jgi:hypothetical protein
MNIVDRRQLAELIARERATYRDRFPGSARAFANSADHLLGGSR